MPLTAQHTQVLIVGAGPSGLMMAAQLLRYGVQPIIIDSKEGPTTHSKALAVQARSLEIYRQMGIIDEVLRNGKKARGVVFSQDGKAGPELAMTNIGDKLTAYPYILMYPQSKNERSLLDYLTLNCCPVYWNTTLTTLTQNATGATTILKDGDTEHTLTCDWVVGADGAHSIVRKQLQILFKGDAYPRHFYLIDANVGESNLTPDYVNLYLSKSDFCAFFPMPDDDNYRILGNLPPELEDKENITIDDILPHINSITASNLQVVKNNWFTTYNLSHRMAERFGVQRCFLVGDAAHIHSPVGGQGMNTGLQDAYNLAWKLAAVVNGQMKPGVLDSYAAERMPVAKGLLKTTDTLFNMIMSGNFFVRLFKKMALFRILATAWKSENIKTAFFKKVSQIEISYRDSNINLHLSKSTKIKAGDRLPYIKIFDEKLLVETDLHEWCSKPGFTLIILGKFDELFLFTVAKWITNKYTGILNFFYLPPSGKNLDVFEAFETNPHQQKAIIVRPDMYIGYINDVADIGMMESYLKNVVGVSSNP
jgi:2-polyprenyl-6-methoxyphenol hydroxylase-like FAD-dependent oxidoreductase